MEELLFLSLLVIVAFLYASVGHGGASGYIALMIIFGLESTQIKNNALVMNLIVSSVAFFNLLRPESFNYRIIGLLLLGSMPAAFVGGMLEIDSKIYKFILGIVLLFPIARLLNLIPQKQRFRYPPTPLNLLIIGVSLGFLSGLLGIGGGILLSPILLLCNWADMRATSVMSALFIFLNSLLGLLGKSLTGITLHPHINYFLAAVLTGGFLGSFWAKRIKTPEILKRVLAFVLLIACYKLFLR